MSKIDQAIKYEVEDALRTLIRAQEIQNDSKLMKEVKAHAKSQKDAITSIAALKGKRDEVIDEEDLPEEVKADKKAKFPNEQKDPELEENTYLKRVEKAREEGEKPDATVVKIAEEECPHCGMDMDEEEED